MQTEIVMMDNRPKEVIHNLPNLCCVRIKSTGLYYLISRQSQEGNKVVLVSLNDGKYNVGTSIVDLYAANRVLEFINEGSWEIIESKIII